MAGMLAGVTVLELGQVIAGTYAGTLLADMGAEVIKIEPLDGDMARNPSIAPLHGESAIHLAMNRGKKSVAVDLKKPEGRELFLRLAEQADVVVENFRPGVTTRLGIDHATLKQRKADIITVSITGFGEYGPARDRPAFDLVVQAYSGILHLTGEPDRPPSRVGIPLADMAASVFACVGILGALCGRELHGNGRHLDVSMLDCLISLLGYDALDYLNSGREVERQGTAHAHMVPWQAFAVKDGYIVVATREERFWHRLCDVIGRPDLKEDPRARDNRARVANREFVTHVLEEVFATKTKAEWMGLLEAHDIPAAPVMDLPGVFSDPQVAARGLVQSYEHPVLGTIRYVTSPLQFESWTPPREPAPMLGQHTAVVLRERLGLDDETVSRMAREGVVRLWPA